MSDPKTDRLGRVVLGFAWFDLGLLVLLLPWTRLWESNSLLVQFPNLIPILLSGYARGVVSGIGLLDMVLAVDALFAPRAAPVAKPQ